MEKHESCNSSNLMDPSVTRVLRALALSTVIGCCAAADWPQWGGAPGRNNAPEGKNIPVQWDIGKFEPRSGDWLPGSAKNIRWVARLGSTTYGSPVVCGGKVFCATNNGAGWVKRYPASVDLGCLLCFAERDGRFGWQLSREKLAEGRALDYPEQGICCAPLVEGKRLWIVTNRCEVVCLDPEGFYDRTDDGPYRSEPNTHRDEADILWIFDMRKELGVTPHNMTACSVTAVGDLLLVGTSNGADEQHKGVPAPKAPSFIALNKVTGKMMWADSSPGENILDGQWSSPAAAVLGGVSQAIFAGGDGWVYSFRADSLRGDEGDRPIFADGRRPPDDGARSAPAKIGTVPRGPELLWKFDCNPKASVWKNDGSGDRSNLIATPVVYDGRVYIATGQDPECGEGPGHLWCIDPTRRGDVSPELVVDRGGAPVPRRRIQAIDASAGEALRPNPNSAAVWHYAGFDANGDGKLDFTETMHRSLSAAAIKDDLLVIADLAGLVHCLDAKTGKVHWTHDLMSQVWGSPCLVDDKIYLGDQDGDVVVFELSAKCKLLAKNPMGDAVYSTPTVANDVLYISTATHLIAVGM